MKDLTPSPKCCFVLSLLHYKKSTSLLKFKNNLIDFLKKQNTTTFPYSQLKIQATPLPSVYKSPRYLTPLAVKERIILDKFYLFMCLFVCLVICLRWAESKPRNMCKDQRGKVRNQLLPSTLGSRNQTQYVRVGSKCYDLLSLPASLLNRFFKRLDSTLRL